MSVRRSLKAVVGRDRGAVTAEFAIVLPAVLMVLGIVVGAMLLATQRLVLTSAAADLARLEARGDSAQAATRLAELGPGVSIERDSRGVLHCVTLNTQGGQGLLTAIGVSGEGCAARASDGYDEG